MSATEQLIAEASRTATLSLAWLVSPWLVDATTQTIRELAASVVDLLQTSPPDSGVARPVVLGCCGTTNPQPAWWRTPLGLLCARHFLNDQRTVTRRVAAEILGISPGTLSPLLARGNTRLRRFGSGELVLGSVFEELVHRSEAGR